MTKTDENISIHEINPFENEIFIALFRKGAYEYLEHDMLGELPDKDRNNILEFSDIKDIRIRKMINRAIHKEKKIRIAKFLPRIIAIVLVVFAICTITIMSVEALRVPFFNLFVNTKEKITTIEADQGQPSDKNSFADLFEYIPNGYELMSEDNQDNTASFIFTNGNGDNIFIDMFNKEHSAGVDTEDAKYNEIMINNFQGFYSIKNGTTNLVFIKDNHTYLILGSIDLEEIIKIAENIK